MAKVIVQVAVVHQFPDRAAYLQFMDVNGKYFDGIVRAAPDGTLTGTRIVEAQALAEGQELDSTLPIEANVILRGLL